MEVVEEALKTKPRVEVYDTILVPAMSRAERDAAAGNLEDQDLAFAWRLRPHGDGTSTEIAVHVDIPPAEAHRLGAQSDVIRRSLVNLARLAAEP